MKILRVSNIRRHVNRGGDDRETALPEIIRLADVPVLERDRPAVGHPEESTLLGLVGAGGPKVLVTEPEVLDMLLEPVVLLLRGYARQMHPVITAILRGSVPVGLRGAEKAQ